jgi:hypothetical protein
MTITAVGDKRMVEGSFCEDDNVCVKVDIMGRDCSSVEGQRRRDVLDRKECVHMLRQWIKILVLVLALLSQVAATCSTGGQQSSGGFSPDSSPPSRGGY